MSIVRRAFLFAMKKILFALLTILLLSCSKSETPEIPDLCTLSGLVSDTLGNALSQAVVTITRTNGADSKSTVTDAKGAFSFDNMHPGTYDLSIEKDGYTSWRNFVKVLERNTDIEIHLERLPAVIDVEINTEMLDFGSTTDSLSLYITPQLRENVEWSLKIADTSWLTASPTYGTLASDTPAKIDFLVNRTTISEPTTQVISILVGTVALPVVVRIEPAPPVVDDDTSIDTPTTPPIDDNNGESIGNYLYFTPDSAAYAITPPIIDAKEWSISFKAKIDTDGNIFWVKSSTHSSDTEGVTQSLTAENNTFKYLHSEYDNRFHFSDSKSVATTIIGDGNWHDITLSGYYTEAQTSYVTVDFFIDEAHVGTIRTLHDESKTPYHNHGITLYIGGSRTVNYALTLPSATFSIADINLSVE